MSSELNESSLERLPPQSLEAEQAVLGALLVSGDGASRIVDILNPEHFYRKAHMVIYAAVLDLYEANEPIDIVTVCQFLKDQGNLDMVGGRQYILDLSLSVATTANLEYYARLVSEKAILRQLIKAGTEIVGSCYEETDADTALDRAEHMIFTLAQKREMQALVHVKHVVETSFQQIETRYENRDSLSGVPSGFYDLDAMTSGFQKSDLVIIAARPSMGKCLAWDSEIVLADGSVTTIENIYKSRGSKIFTLGNDYKFHVTEPSHFVDDGIKPVYRVTTRLGRSIETTLAHPFLTKFGWQRLEHIHVGDQIAIPRHIPVFGTNELRDCEVKLMALLAADGTLRRGEVSFSNHNPMLQQDFRAAVIELLQGTALRKVVGDTSYGAPRTAGLNASPRPTWMGNSPIATWRESVGLPVGGSPSEIPSAVFTLPRKQLALFLNRLFAASSRVSIDENGKLQIAYTSSSERLVKQIQHLLLRFGILSSVNRKVRFIERRKQSFQLDIFDLESVEIFGTEIGIFGVEELKNDSNKTGSAAEKFKNDIFWDEIVSIESLSCKQVYDLTIPETHNFVSNDICVHNTAFVLNVAQAAAMENNTPVAIFSLEMSKESLVMRMLCSTAEIDSNRLRTGHMHTSDWTKLAGAMGRIGEAPIFIDDSAMVNALEIRAKCRRLKAENNGLGMVIIDYIQLMQGRKATDNRVQEVSEISRSLKQLAREIDVPVLALSQLSRAVEQRQNKRPMLSDLRESGCLTGDTLVLLPDSGEYVRIDSLVGKTGFRVLAVDPTTYKLESKEVQNSFCTGTKPVYKLRTRLNRTIKATANHKFLTINGWKRLDEIKPGEALAMPREIRTSSTASMSLDELALLGYLIGDGCTLARHSIQYTSADYDLAQDAMRAALATFGEQLSPRINKERNWYQVYFSSKEKLARGKRNAIAQWLDDLGIFNLRSTEKFIPNKVFQQPAEYIAHFLRRLWSTDGCVSVSSGIPRIYYASSSEQLARGVQSLLLRLGINARIVQVSQGTKGVSQFHVSISGMPDQQKFVSQVGVNDLRRQSKLIQIQEIFEGRIGNTNRDLIPKMAWKTLVEPARVAAGLSTREFQSRIGTSYCGSTLYKSGISRQRAHRVASVVQSSKLSSLAESDVYWDEVVSIDALGEEKVYDLTVADHHNFVANDIIVHNSIEQDADLVMFIYRDEYYNPETDKRGEAEIIIAKQRNGPVGTAELLYQGSITRFLNKVHTQYNQV